MHLLYHSLVLIHTSTRPSQAKSWEHLKLKAVAKLSLSHLQLPSLFIFTAEYEVHTSREDAEEDQFVLSNPLYGSPQHQDGISSQSGEPYQSYANFSTTESPDHSSTLHDVSNPIYGMQSQPLTTDGAYSAPMPVTQDYTTVTFKGNENEVVDTSGAILVEISDSSAV